MSESRCFGIFKRSTVGYVLVVTMVGVRTDFCRLRFALGGVMWLFNRFWIPFLWL